jgi:hypothetical protein
MGSSQSKMPSEKAALVNVDRVDEDFVQIGEGGVDEKSVAASESWRSRWRQESISVSRVGQWQNTLLADSKNR